MRMAQARARNQRFYLQLPPFDSFCSIQSALSQVAEALAADRIDPRRAQAILCTLRMASQNLKHAALWHENTYRNEDSVSYDEFEAESGLPDNLDLDLDTPPEVAFPPPSNPPRSVILRRPPLRRRSGGTCLSPRHSPRRHAAIPYTPSAACGPCIGTNRDRIIAGTAEISTHTKKCSYPIFIWIHPLIAPGRISPRFISEFAKA